MIFSFYRSHAGKNGGFAPREMRFLSALRQNKEMCINRHTTPRRHLSADSARSTKAFHAGVTLIELLVVISIMVIITVVALPNFLGRRNTADLKNAGTQIAALLRQAQTDSMAQKSGMSWGVHFQSPSGSAPSYALFSSTSSVYSVSGTTGFYRLPNTVGYLSANSVPSGLVGWWKFDEGGGTNALDSSGQNATGTWQGNLGSQWTTGKVGPYAGNFTAPSNNDYISFPSTSYTLLQASQNTLAMWVYVKGVGPNTESELYSNGIGGSPGNNTTDILLYPSGVNFWLNGYLYTVPLLATRSTSTWYYFTCEIDRSALTATVYLNGVYQGQAGFTTYSPAGNPPDIGGIQSTGNAGDYMQGYVDDVRIYNRALSPAEINQLSLDVAFSQVSGAASASTSVGLYLLGQPSSQAVISVASSGEVGF
jgi:prepilin-type N-terminal cleavage/methylation domain-containing protein